MRYGHRPKRDKRISTHLALVARAFGADEIWFDEKDQNIEEKLEGVNRTFGGGFKVKTGVNWKEALTTCKEQGWCIVHLTMYGMPLPQIVKSIRREERDMLILVGGPKVPRLFYEIADYNVSVTNQPHSEVAALAVFLDWLLEGKEFQLEFRGGRLKIIPSERGKHVEALGGGNGEPC